LRIGRDDYGNDYAKVSQALEENSWRWSPKSSKVSQVKQSSDIT
jgi:hypothetical protein